MDLLTIVRQCHNDDPWADESLTPFLLSAPPAGVQIGFLPRSVTQAIKEDVQSGRTHAFGIGQGKRPYTCSSIDIELVWIHDDLDTHEKRSKALQGVVESWRDRHLFPDPLQGWRNELYSIYGPGRRAAFSLERSACALFGLATFGVHLTAYTGDVQDESLRIWVPRRAKNKSTWPSFLDNSVAGGITAGDSPYESMVRECGEEAGLAEDTVRSTMKQTGVISYFYRTKSGLCQPEVEYTYDLALSASVELRPADGEAESFVLMSVDEILVRMRKGEFKPNCALVLIDFLLRHGRITAESCDCDYVELMCSLHNRLRLPGP